MPPGPEPEGSGDPATLAGLRARSKCLGAQVPGASPPGLVLGVDTVVDLDGRELGKPVDRDDARRMLLQLAGREHAVHTAHCLRRHPALGPVPERPLHEPTVHERLATARVLCRSLDFDEVAAYLDSGEWVDKAGGYGIQGHASRFCALVGGDLDTVIGLSVRAVQELLQTAM